MHNIYTYKSHKSHYSWHYSWHTLSLSLVFVKIWELVSWELSIILDVHGYRGEAHVTHCSTQYTAQSSEVAANLRRWSRGMLWGACD